jgi:predicted DNA-binding transcriptional regulator AlpA
MQRKKTAVRAAARKNGGQRKIPPIAPGAEWLQRRQVEARYGISRRTLQRFVANGQFPKPCYLFGPFNPFWRVSELRAFDSASAATKRTAPPAPRRKPAEA